MWMKSVMRRTPRESPGFVHDAALLIACLCIVYTAMLIGAIASVDAAAFYARLSRPGWAPPAGLFGPVWTLLYTFMAVALWRVWRHPAPHAAASGLFLFQLAVNALWSWLFFRWHLGAAAFAGAVVLLVVLALTVKAFWRVSQLAALLLLPYFGWVGFATALTWIIWRMNPSLLG